MDVPGEGHGIFTLNASRTAINYQVAVDHGSLSGVIVAAHFHNAPAGENGGVVHTLNTDKLNEPNGITAGIWSAEDVSLPLTPALMAALFRGDLYINIHTEANPDGEIRAGR